MTLLGPQKWPTLVSGKLFPTKRVWLRRGSITRTSSLRTLRGVTLTGYGYSCNANAASPLPRHRAAVRHEHAHQHAVAFKQLRRDKSTDCAHAHSKKHRSIPRPTPAQQRGCPFTTITRGSTLYLNSHETEGQMQHQHRQSNGKRRTTNGVCRALKLDKNATGST